MNTSGLSANADAPAHRLPGATNHCALFQTDEIQAVIGDASRGGMGGRQYCGVWSLTSRHRPFNAFGNSYAGLIPGEIRGKSPTLKIVGESACSLTREPDDLHPSRVSAEYQLTAPCYIDHTLTLTDQRDLRKPGCNFREVTWCSYMNCPDDPRISFRSNNNWFRYMSPAHGIGSNIAPAYVLDEDLERWPARRKSASGNFWEPFHWDRIPTRFDEPFYYGRLGNMVICFVFDTPDWLRFYCSPNGGGESLISGKACPAWDFEWVIPDAAYEVGRTYTFRMRVIYKPFVSDSDIMEECRRCRAKLGFLASSPPRLRSHQNQSL